MLHWPHRLDLEALSECAAALVGTHDFTAFTPTETEHVRFSRDVFAAQWRRAGELLEFWIEADAFMRHMNRVLVGTMLEVASGGGRSSSSSRCSRAGRGPRRARRRRPTACTWSAWGTAASGCWLSGAVDKPERHALAVRLELPGTGRLGADHEGRSRPWRGPDPAP